MSRCVLTVALRGMLAAALLAALPFEQTANAQGNWSDLFAQSERPRQQQRRPREPAPPAAKPPEKAPEKEPEKQPEKQPEKPPDIPAESSVFQPACDNPKNRDEAVVCEQRRLAKAVEDSVALAASQFWLAIFGFAGVFAALLFNAWAAMTAGRAARAAKDQAQMSSESLMNSERAFVFVQNFHAETVHDASDGNKILGWNVFVEWKNTGKTPTKNCAQRGNYQEFNRPISPDFDFPNLKVSEYQWLLIGPSATAQSGKYFIPIDKILKIRAGELHAYLWGWIEYDDVFDNTLRHRTEYGYKIIAGGGMSPEQVAIGHMATPRHNAADKECFHKVISRPPVAA
jgi:hypothetical protein